MLLKRSIRTSSLRLRVPGRVAGGAGAGAGQPTLLIGRRPCPSVPPFVSQHQHQHHYYDALSTDGSSTALHQSAPFSISSAVAAVGGATASSSSSASLLQLVATFIAGGLFFSSVLAAVAAVYAVGLQNARRGWDLFGLVLKNVWITFAVGVGEARKALLARGSSAAGSPSSEQERSKWHWRDGWQVLKDSLVLTRKKAAEGVQAIRMEANLYAAAVGAPGLIPLQYVLDRLLPFSIQAQLQEALQDSLNDIARGNKNIKRLQLKSFSAGGVSPKLEAARVYDLGDRAMAFDCNVHWKSALQAHIHLYAAGGLARLPVAVKNVDFNGVLRVVLVPLVAAQPGFGAALVSFPTVPVINLDVKLAGGEVTRVPWLRSELVGAIQKGVTEELLWPHRIVIPTMNAAGRPLLGKKQLDALARSDPLLQAEQALEARQATNEILRQSRALTKPNPRSLRKLTKIFVNRREAEAEKEEAEASINKEDDKGTGKDPQERHDDRNTAAAAPFVDPTRRIHHAPPDRVQKGFLWGLLTTNREPEPAGETA